MTFHITYHSNHLRCKVEGRPDMWVDGEEDEPYHYASPDCHVRQLYWQQQQQHRDVTCITEQELHGSSSERFIYRDSTPSQHTDGVSISKLKMV